MKKNFVFGIILATIVSLSPSVGSAEGITGFQDFQFGMSLSDVQATASLTPTKRDDSGHWYETSQMVTILGNDYTQALVFNDEEALIQVNVIRKFESNRFSCKSEFDSVYRSVRARYGDPDQPPQRVDLNDAEINAADFTQSDGSKVFPTSTWLSGNCTISVAYISAPVGSVF